VTTVCQQQKINLKIFFDVVKTHHNRDTVLICFFELPPALDGENDYQKRLYPKF
jgi:hypothetical protein